MLPVRQAGRRGAKEPGFSHLDVLREPGKGMWSLPCSGPLTSQARPAMPLGVGAETQPAAVWGGPWGGVPQEGRQGVLCPDSLRVLSVAMGRLVAELPVIVSAVALDMDAADTIPQVQGLLVFTGGRLAAATAGGLQQGVVRDSGGLVEEDIECLLIDSGLREFHLGGGGQEDQTRFHPREEAAC